jgi:hypothetical protein
VRAQEPDAPGMLLAKVTPPERAFVLDYQANIGTNDFTFQADTTYVVLGRLDLYGTTTFEGSAVIKATNVYGADLWVHGPMVWDTGLYRPVVFTSKDDDSVGQPLPGSTGNPQRQQHVGLVVAQSGTVRGARFLYARTALCPVTASLTAEDVQFVDCGNAIDAWGQPVTVRNGLFSQINNLVASHIANLTVAGEHWTGDAFGALVTTTNYTLAALNLTNCLFTAGTTWVAGTNNPTLNTNSVVWLANSSGVYQTAGAGRYYLAESSTYRNAGATNLSASAQALIQPRTTAPPLVLSNTTITVDTTLSPQAPRDTDTPDLGYHAAPLDYLCSQVFVTNALLQVAPGTALGHGGGPGLVILGQGRVQAEGTAPQPVTFAAYPGVQEQPVRWPAGSPTPGYPLRAYRYGTSGGEGRLRFVQFFGTGLPTLAVYQSSEWTFNPLDVRHCQFYHVSLQLDQAPTNEVTRASLVNNLFVRAPILQDFLSGDYGGVDFQANTLHGGYPYGLYVESYGAPADRWRVQDNLFHESAVFMWNADHSYNAYATNAYAGANTYTEPALTTNDLTLASFAFDTGALGGYYLPTNSPLLNAGSLPNAASVGLYHFTTQTNQTKEGATRLDLGYHHVAVTNGLPVDTDNDGLPDYQDEDADGDGLPDAWEFEHFGNLSEDWDGDYDGDGTTNSDEYLDGTDPNTFSLMTQYETLQTTNRTVTGACLVFAGVPASMTVLVNDTNVATATWAPFASNFTATLPNTDGVHTVVLAVRGMSPNIPAVLDATDITLDRVPPVLCLTNPASTTVSKPYLQLQGWANEPLANLAYDLTNAVVTLTNEPAYVVDQYFDTNQFDFTTNYFQAYDLELTNGANAITLRVSDLAGNVTTTNFTVTLSYASATNSPVLALIWPTNGTALSGDTFFLRGHINDETARLWAENVIGGVTNEFPGLVERDGMFWVESLPLATGTNWFNVKALDAAGNLSSTNLAVVQSSVSLAITSTPEGDALYTPFGTVSGAVTATNPAYNVTVNGVAAAVDAYGNWTAENVPVLGRGTATFTAVAAGAGGAPVSGVAAAEEKPARVEIHEYDADKYSEDHWSGGYFERRVSVKIHTNSPVLGPLGAVADWYTNSTSWSKYYYLWTTTNAITEWSLPGDSGSSPSIYDPDGSIRCLPEQDVLYPAFQGWFPYYITHYYARSVSNYWSYPDGDSATAGVKAQTMMKLHTGGKSGSERKHLIHIEAWAEQYGRPPGGIGPSGFPWWDTPVTNIPPTKIFVLDEPLIPRSSGSKGDLYRVLPDNESPALGLQVPGVKHYGAWATATRHELLHETLHPALADTDLARTNLGVGEYVECWLDPGNLPGDAVWTASSGGWWETNVGNCVWYIAPSNAATVTVTAKVAGKAELSITFNVKEPTGYAKPPTHLAGTIPMTPTNTQAGAGMKNWVYIAPTDVSFYRIQMKEASGPATNKWGCYTNSSIVTQHYNDVWYDVSENNVWSSVPDTAEGRIDSADMPPPGGWVAGGLTWRIPVYWTIGAQAGQRDTDPELKLTLMTHWNQGFEVDNAGKYTVTKFDAIASRTLDDHYETSETPNPNQ